MTWASPFPDPSHRRRERRSAGGPHPAPRPPIGVEHPPTPVPRSRPALHGFGRRRAGWRTGRPGR